MRAYARRQIVVEELREQTLQITLVVPSLIWQACYADRGKNPCTPSLGTFEDCTNRAKIAHAWSVPPLAPSASLRILRTRRP